MNTNTPMLLAALAITACSEDIDTGRAWAPSLGEEESDEEPTDDPPTTNIQDRPNFLLPFPCNADVETVTYFGHDPDDKKMDMRRKGMPTGSDIVAAASGLVHQQFNPGGIEIRHGGGWFTTYMHMKWHVAVGTHVEQGDVVGEMGNVGSPDYHLHHEQLYAPGLDNANKQHIVNPVLQGEGPMVLVPNQPFTRRSTNCGRGELEPYGVIGIKWRALGGTASPVGEPIRRELAALFGGRFQDFEDGMIIWHPQRASHAWMVHGRIFEHYRDTGSEAAWGFPTMDEMAAAAAPDGTRGRYQYFEDALIMWSAPTDAQVIAGPILDEFEVAGREQALGYPLSAAVVEGGDGLSQAFQDATIHWSPAEGAWIE